MVQVPIATGFYVDPTRPIANQECTNWRPQIPQTNAQTEAQLIHTAGIRQFANTGDFSARGEHEFGGIAYTVNGARLYRINSDGTTTDLGEILGAGQVSIADNGLQMCIVVPGAQAYIYDTTNGLQQITDANFITTLGPSQQVVHHDGYFVHFNNNAPASSSPIFFISNLNNGLVYNALDFGSAETDPDEITALHVNRNRLYVAGKQTIEPFVNVGGAGFPYQRVRGAVVQQGISAKFSARDFNSSFVFVGAGEDQRPSVWQFTGGSAERISTNSIDSILQKMTDGEIAQINGSVYAENGLFVYYMHLNDRTFGYDSSTGLWHERQSKDIDDLPTNWRVAGIVEAYGRILVTDNQTGMVGEMSEDFFIEYDKSIRRTVISGPLNLTDQPISEVELICESGTANISGGSSDPMVQMSFSDDGGYTFGNVIARSLGKQGEYGKRQIWRRGGKVGRNPRMYKFVVDEEIKISIIGLDIR